MAREMECDTCGYVESFDNIATAAHECPKCGSNWGPKYD